MSRAGHDTELIAYMSHVYLTVSYTVPCGTWCAFQGEHPPAGPGFRIGPLYPLHLKKGD